MKQNLSIMKRAAWAVSASALAFSAAPALAETASSSEDTVQHQREARIPFADNGGIRDWQAGERDDVLYVQDRHRNWYKATLFSPAFALGTQWAIGVDAGAIGTFDRFSHVIVDGRRHAIQSLVRVNAPPGDDQRA